MNAPINVTPAELKRFNAIKAKCASGKSRSVSDIDRQWVLDMMRRYSVEANSVKILDQAKAQGFNVDGIKSKD